MSDIGMTISEFNTMQRKMREDLLAELKGELPADADQYQEGYNAGYKASGEANYQRGWAGAMNAVRTVVNAKPESEEN